MLNTWIGLNERYDRQFIVGSSQGLVGLFDAVRPGRKPRWQEEDIAYLEERMIDSEPILIGYLGALPSPHVHIQTAFGYGEQLYMRRPRFEPTVNLL